MCSAKIVFAVFAWTTVANYVFVSGQIDEEEGKEPPEEEMEPPPVDIHTFVALIDILFVDRSKRQCTGTIIHDKAVITAAHCFVKKGVKYAGIELASSFVIIGTKKMFDTGYENYLPIERILTHPKYKGWTADLALVFTFAGMTTDKPGHAIMLVQESVTAHMDSNVTIVSWGRCADDEVKKPGTKPPGDKKRRCTSTEEENDSCELPRTYIKALREGTRSSEQERSSEATSSHHRPFHGYKTDEGTVDLARVTTARNSHRVLGLRNVQRLSQENSPYKPNNSNVPHKAHERLEPQLIGVDNQTINIESSQAVTAEVKDRKWPKDQMFLERRSGLNTSLDEKTGIQSYYKNWRRQDKTQNNKDNTLTIETFGFVNVQTCKKLVDKVLSTLYRINTNEVVCYAADEHYISDSDSGAPALHNSQLVAVTVGGVECDGDHVAIGMKMNHFCSWILENLPEPNVDWKCCKDCLKVDEGKKRKVKY